MTTAAETEGSVPSGAPATVLYIAGYGRSGSTLLERILASHPDIDGLGEVEHLSRADDLHAVTCGCGEPIDSCELWGPLVGGLQRDVDFTRVREGQDAADAWKPRRLGSAAGGAGPAESESALYDRFNIRLFAELNARLGTPRYLIDSSKTARLNALRPFSLVRAGLPVRLVHLVRDGRGAMWSYVSKGSNRRLERGEEPQVRLAGLRSALSWRLANRAAEKFGEVYPDRYLRVRYEDLTAEPRVTLQRLGTFLDVDLAAQIEALEAGTSFPRVHQMAGNRMRSDEAIVLRPDAGWKAELPRRLQVLFRFVSGRMARRYGYEP